MIDKFSFSEVSGYTDTEKIVYFVFYCMEIK